MYVKESRQDSRIRFRTMNLEQTKQIFYHLSLQFLVDDMKSKSFRASAFHLGKQVPNFFFSGHLFSKVLALNEVTKLGITMAISNLMEFNQSLMNSLFKLQLALDGVSGWVPFLSLEIKKIVSKIWSLDSNLANFLYINQSKTTK